MAITLGEKISRLRRERNLSQNELGRIVEVHGRHIGKLEKDLASPSAEIVKRLADLFDVTTDYLIQDNGTDKIQTTPIRDKKLLKQFEEIDQLSEEEKEHIKYLIQLVIDRNKFKEMLKQTA